MFHCEFAQSLENAKGCEFCLNHAIESAPQEGTQFLLNSV